MPIHQKRESIAAVRHRFQAGLVDKAELQSLAGDSRAGIRALVERAHATAKRAAQEQQRLVHMLQFERVHWGRGLTLVAGVDEAGAGPLAGPVVAAAVVLPVDVMLQGIDDSKKLSEKKRRSLDAEIRQVALAWGIGVCEPAEIDAINILQASRQAMRRAVSQLRQSPQHLLVDARNVPGVSMPQTAIIGGDALSQSIAAASVLAKVYRDSLMERLAEEHPGYGFEQHRGYGTAAHVAALQKLGPSNVHRMSFGPVAEAALSAGSPSRSAQ